MQDPSRPRQRPWLEQLMLAWHLSWQLCLSFEHARQFGPLCPGSQSSMAVTGVVVGGPVVGEEEKGAAVTSTVPNTMSSTTHVAGNAAARGMASRVDLLQRPCAAGARCALDQ